MDLRLSDQKNNKRGLSSANPQSPTLARFRKAVAANPKAKITMDRWIAAGARLEKIWGVDESPESGWLRLFLGKAGDQLIEQRRVRQKKTKKALRLVVAGLKILREVEPTAKQFEDLEYYDAAQKHVREAFDTRRLGVAWNYLPLAALGEYISIFTGTRPLESEMMAVVNAALTAVRGKEADHADTVEAIRKGFARFLANNSPLLELLKERLKSSH